MIDERSIEQSFQKRYKTRQSNIKFIDLVLGYYDVYGDRLWSYEGISMAEISGGCYFVVISSSIFSLIRASFRLFIQNLKLNK